jgi:hypothetical protein
MVSNSNVTYQRSAQAIYQGSAQATYQRVHKQHTRECTSNIPVTGTSNIPESAQAIYQRVHKQYTSDGHKQHTSDGHKQHTRDGHKQKPFQQRSTGVPNDTHALDWTGLDWTAPACMHEADV